MRNFTSNEQEVVTFFESRLIVGNDWVSPTEVACKLRGIKYHSAWASPICKRLVNKGILERSDKGWYRINPKRIKEG